MGRVCSTENRNAYRILGGKPEGKRPLRRPRRKLVDNIKMDLCVIDWIALAQNRDGSCAHGNKPSGYVQFSEIPE
jgi:hypothetical protein